MSDAPHEGAALGEEVLSLLSERLGEGDRSFLVLVELESGATVGLDASGAWHYGAEEDEPVRFEKGRETGFAEVVEMPRRDFEDRLEAAASQHGLPCDDIVLAFPAIPLIRALLAQRSGYMWRLALLWMLPSEVGLLQDEIRRVARAADAPGAVKDLAQRLLR